MTDKHKQAAECREQARLCLETAEQMSIREQRERLIEMAQHWLALAREAETEDTQRPRKANSGSR